MGLKISVDVDFSIDDDEWDQVSVNDEIQSRIRNQVIDAVMSSDTYKEIVNDRISKMMEVLDSFA